MRKSTPADAVRFASLASDLPMSWVLNKGSIPYIIIKLLKIVDQIRFEMFSYAFIKLFLDTSRLGYKIVKGLLLCATHNDRNTSNYYTLNPQISYKT